MKNGKTFVIGDIHGAHRALMECLELSGFENGKDQLICLGDAYDGWPDVYEVMETLLGVKNLVYILGNHDYWALQWMKSGFQDMNWIKQGGDATVRSYKSRKMDRHMRFLEETMFYYEPDNKLFVHGNVDPNMPIHKQNKTNLLWERSLVYKIMEGYGEESTKKKYTSYDEVYLGHTPTLNFGTTLPIHSGEVWLLDTGAGWNNGVLTIMDIDTKEYFQSKKVDQLYPEVNGRGNKGEV
jgi:serine/threonine protein phosphatase 1